MNWRLLIFAGLLGGAAGPALAHHSFAMFDHEKLYIWEGTVQNFDWSNPHTHVTVVVPASAKDPKTVGTWDLEGAPPNIMSRQGWAKNSFKPGDKITVVGQPMRSGAKGGSIWYAVTADGRHLYEDVNRNGGPGANGHGVPPGFVLP